MTLRIPAVICHYISEVFNPFYRVNHTLTVPVAGLSYGER